MAANSFLLKKFNKHPFFESGRAFFFIVSLLARLVMQLYFFGMNYDRSFQLVGARNFIGGHGIMVNGLSTSANFQQIYSPIASWPPGYSLIIGLISFIIGHKIILAAILFDLLSAFLFFFFSRRILVILNTPASIINLFTLVSGFFAYDFCQDATTDLNAVAFFMFAFYMCLSYLASSNKTIVYILILTFINFICPFLRFMYIPISFIIPAYLFFAGYHMKNKRIKNAGAISLFINCILILCLLVFQYKHVGSATYMSTTEKGFYAPNLLRFYPIIISAFINIRFYLNNPSFYSIINTSVLYSVLWVLNILCIGIFLFSFIRYVLSKKWKAFTLWDHYFFIGSLVSLFILFLLSFLSLRYSLPDHFTGGWTYVQEPRYMAFIVLFIQQLFFILTIKNQERFKSLGKLFIYILSFLLFAELLHGIYFTGKIIKKDFAGSELPNPGLTQFNYIKNLIRTSRRLNNRKIIFISNDATVCNIASLENAYVSYNLTSIHKITDNCTNCYIFVALDTEKKGPETQIFIKEAEKKKIKVLDNFIYYEYACP